MGTIAQKLTAVTNSKAAIASAITGKGGTVPTKFSDYGTAVSSLPNTYTAGDEGKVVSNGALVSQTSLSITENNTYDTTTKNSVTVNVSGGGVGPIVEIVSRQKYPTTWTVSASDLAGVTSIGDYAFYGCSGLTSIVIPDSVTSIGKEAFESCGHLSSITIPSTVTSIGMSAFINCSGLTSITIPDGVTIIEQYTFKNCAGLVTIDFGSTRNTVCSLFNTNAFSGVLPANYQILVPSALLTDWKAAGNWNNSAIVDHIVAHP